MSDDDGRISRRRVLGALGGIGATGALGGSTSALLWDEEVFGSMELPNVLAAGKLDLDVDWTEHYVDWIGDEAAVEGVRMVDSPADIGSDEVGLPTPEHPMIAVTTEDTDGDGTPQLREFRTATTTDTSGMTDDPDPVITLQDVKPGDFGEVTLSYHVKNNPAFVSLCSGVEADVDNGYPEPEDAVDGAMNDADGTEGGDLGEHVRATAWYDPNCNNRFDGGEVEVMLANDVSESMAGEFPGTPEDVDGDTGDASQIEAVRAAVGDHGGSGFLSDLEETCDSNVEVGTVSFSEDLNHLDDYGDGESPDAGSNAPGFDANGQDALLDQALTPVGQSAADDPNPSGTGSGYADLKKLYGTGDDFADGEEFVIDDDSDGAEYGNDGNEDYDAADGTTTFVAERPYTENGDSTQDDGVVKAHTALLADGTTAPSGRTGIDPFGAANPVGDARKMIVVFFDGSFSAEEESGGAEGPATISDKAEQDGIEIQPIVVNQNPSGNDVATAEKLATPDREPLFAVQYDGSPGDCDDDVTAAGYSCTSLVDAVEMVRADVCATAGGERRIAGPASINEVLGQLDDCTLLEPGPSGSTVAGKFGSPCHATTSKGCVALAWWLPRDIPGVDDNVVQTDRYEFTLGFKAVQCRHNATADGPKDTATGGGG